MKWILGCLFLIAVAHAQVGPIPAIGTFLNAISACPFNAAAHQYYVSAAGSDANCGTTIASPWQTIAKVNSKSYPTSTTFSFRGGDTFTGGLVLTTSIVASNPTINSYGTGQATLSSGNTQECIRATSIPGLTVDNITCVGGGNAINSTNGIFVLNNLAGSTPISGPTITNNNVTGYGANCIQATALNGSGGFGDSGFSVVNIYSNTMHACGGNDVPGAQPLLGGGGNCFYISGGSGGLSDFNSVTSLTVRGNTVFDCQGTVGMTHTTGDGILIFGATNILVDHNLIYNTGSLGGFASSGGPVGLILFVCGTASVTFNEIYDSHTGAGEPDGENLNLSGCRNSVVEYNYLHGHADFASILIDAAAGNPTSVTYRFNVVEATTADAIHFSLPGPGVSQGLAVYNNTFYLGSGIGGFSGGCTPGASFTPLIANNIFYAANGNVFYSLDIAPCGNGAKVTITGNDYFDAAGSFTSTISGTVYTTLASLQASGYERLPGPINVGTTSNPLLTAPGSGVTCNGYFPPCPTAYALQTSSTIKVAGLNLTNIYSNAASAVVISLGTSDFYGNPITATTLPIGAAAVSTAVFVGPLDVVGGASACLSLRACSGAIATAGTQKLVNVRNSATAETCDILVNSSGGLGNTTACSGSSGGQAAATFCGGGGGSCTVRTFYDQSSNSNDVSQTTVGNQPPLSFNCVNTTLPCMTFDNARVMTNTSSVGGSPVTFSWVAERTGNTAAFNGVLNCGRNLDSTPIENGFSNSANTIAAYAGTVVNLAGTFNDNAWHAAEFVNNAASGITNVDGTAQSGVNAGTNACNTTTTKGMVWGGDTVNTNGLTGKATEGLIYLGALSATVINNLCHNQRLYWGTSGSC